MVNFTRYGDSELIGIGLCRESDVYTLSEEGVSRFFLSWHLTPFRTLPQKHLGVSKWSIVHLGMPLLDHFAEVDEWKRR